MGNGCPHSLGQRLYYNWVKGQNRVSPRIITEIEDVANAVSDYISGEDQVQKIISGISNLEEFDYETINGVFEALFKTGSFGILKSRKMKKYLEKRSAKENPKIPDKWGRFLSTVMTDMFITVAMYIHSSNQYENPEVLKQRLKGLIFINMNKSDGRVNTSLSSSINTNIKYGDGNINEYIERMKWFMKRKMKEHEYNEPSCVFAMSNEHIEWVNEVWDFFEEQIFPELKKAFIKKNKSGYMEDFFSGNRQ